jgi:DNA-binding PadR family transcriptional regulator
MIDERKYYGLEMMEEIKIRLKSEGYLPPQSELYRALNDLLKDGIIYGIRQIKGNHDATGDFQEIILYQFTDDGRKRAETLKVKLKYENI